MIKHYDNRQVGFGSSITVAFSTIKYCIKNNQKCHINIENIMYGTKNQNLWDLFLEQPFNIKIDIEEYNVNNTTNPFILNCWEYPDMDVALKKLRDNNHIREYQEIYKKYFITKTEILTAIDNFCQNFENKKILGIHKRGRDQFSNRGHGRGQKEKLNINYIFSIVDREIEKYDGLFLTSDENYVYKEFSKRYGKKLIFLDSKDNIPYPDKGLHDIFINHEVEIKNKLLKMMILETIILSKCDRLLLVNSNLSQIALYLSGHLNYKFYDQHVHYIL